MITDYDIQRLIDLFSGTGDSVEYWTEVETGALIKIIFRGISTRFIRGYL